MTRCLPIACALALAACSGGGALSSIPDAHKPPRQVAIDIQAAPKLNTNRKGQPLALVARIYKLRQRAAFDQAPFDVFLHPAREQEALGADLLEVKEVMLIPGQHYKVTEKVSHEAGFVGVVALFHNPASQRWRAAFAAADIEKTGLTLGAHACSLTTPAASSPARC
jgi:type VI secretion system protein VasD